MQHIVNDDDWHQLPDLRPLIKLHKTTIGYRRVINAKNWYTSFACYWLNTELHGITSLIQEKLNIHIILENSFEAINNHHDVNNEKLPFERSRKYKIRH